MIGKGYSLADSVSVCRGKYLLIRDFFGRLLEYLRGLNKGIFGGYLNLYHHSHMAAQGQNKSSSFLGKKTIAIFRRNGLSRDKYFVGELGCNTSFIKNDFHFPFRQDI
jgi:hypothetical protein